MFVGTVVCVKLVEAKELKGVKENKHKGFGVTAEEGSVWLPAGGCEEDIGRAGLDASTDGNSRSTLGF